MTSLGSPTLNPPIANPEKLHSISSSTERRLNSG